MRLHVPLQRARGRRGEGTDRAFVVLDPQVDAVDVDLKDCMYKLFRVRVSSILGGYPHLQVADVLRLIVAVRAGVDDEPGLHAQVHLLVVEGHGRLGTALIRALGAGKILDLEKL